MEGEARLAKEQGTSRSKGNIANLNSMRLLICRPNIPVGGLLNYIIHYRIIEIGMRRNTKECKRHRITEFLMNCYQLVIVLTEKCYTRSFVPTMIISIYYKAMN